MGKPSLMLIIIKKFGLYNHFCIFTAKNITMRQTQLLNTLRKAATCMIFALFCLSAAAQDLIDLSKTPVLCNQIQIFRLKEVLPNGYAYYYDSDNTELVLTRDNGNRYTSEFPKSPYIHSCDYVVKKLGDTVTVIACLEQYQEENPYYVLFAADSQEKYISKWQQRIKGGMKHCDWLFSVPIDLNFIFEIDINQLKQMLSLLEQSKQRNDLIEFNINQLKMAIESYNEDADCDAE